MGCGRRLSSGSHLESGPTQPTLAFPPEGITLAVGGKASQTTSAPKKATNVSRVPGPLRPAAPGPGFRQEQLAGGPP